MSDMVLKQVDYPLLEQSDVCITDSCCPLLIIGPRPTFPICWWHMSWWIIIAIFVELTPFMFFSNPHFNLQCPMQVSSNIVVVPAAVYRIWIGHPPLAFLVVESIKMSALVNRRSWVQILPVIFWITGSLKTPSTVPIKVHSGMGKKSSLKFLTLST